MRASRIPIALSAFALGILVAQGASWLLHVGEPSAAHASSSDAARPALSLNENGTPSAALSSTQRSTNSTATQAEQEATDVTHDSSVRTVVTDESAPEEVNLDAMIAQLYAESPEDFLALIVDKLLKDGEPLRALALLNESEGVGGYLYGEVGQALREDGQVAAAIEAFTESLRIDPMSSDGFQPLLELDPSTALMIVQEGLAWQPPPGNSSMRIRLANALLAAGQEEEAKKLVEELRTAGVKGDAINALFNQLAPEEAEAELRGSVDTAVGKKKRRPMQKLAAMLQESGRDEEARAVIDSLLELNPDDARARRLLGKLDKEALLELLDQRTQANPKANGLWTEYGDALEAEGRRVDAISAWEQSLNNSGSSSAFARLLEHSPNTAWNSLENYTQNSGNDERWGDFGDLLWEHGRESEAKRAWEKAWELDPNDSEWYGKLQAMQVGRDPLN